VLPVLLGGEHKLCAQAEHTESSAHLHRR